jgi:glycosyltransferase involved in cell wall biosynthesis
MLTTVHQPYDTRVFHKEAKSLAKVHDVVLIAPDEEKADKEVDGVRIITIKKPGSKVLHPVTMWRVFKAGFNQDCDVYHCHEPGSLFVCAILKVLRGEKLIYDAHEHYPSLIAEDSLFPDFIRPLVRFFVDVTERVLVRFADAVITVNESLQKHYEQIGKGASIIYNFPDLKNFNPDKKNDRLEKKYAQNKIVIYEGGVSRKRGLDKFILALPKVRKVVLNVEFLVVGKLFDTSDFEKWIEDYLKKQKLHETFEMVGWKPHEEVVNYINISDVGIILFQPTHYNNLIGLPIKLFEYMACGLPVVASNFPEISRVVKEADCGILVDPTDVGEIADAIVYMLEHPEEAMMMGESGREI